jgi:S-methylmethionine-dependent homocysteine/selenocysteine methylase
MAAAVAVAREAIGASGQEVTIGVYANAFPPMRKDATANETVTEIRADLDPAGYLGLARVWQAQGARIVGGCCGIGPEHVAALRTGLVTA